MMRDMFGLVLYAAGFILIGYASQGGPMFFISLIGASLVMLSDLFRS